MSVRAAFMVPHPPMIVPAVGRGSERQISETAEAYERVAEEIAALKPETIVILSPHAVMYADYFHLSPGREAAGSFRAFGAPSVRFREAYDTELRDRIVRLAEFRGFPAGTLGERDPALDHGTMVPLYFIRKRYSGGKILRIGLSGLPLEEHYRFGEILNQAVEETGRSAVLVASGDLSHKLKESGPYGFAAEGPLYDARIMEVCGRGDFGELFRFEEHFLEKAAECGHRSFVIMAGVLDRKRVRAKALSHQDVTGVGYGICTFYPEGEDPSRNFLEQREQAVLKALSEARAKEDPCVRLARQTIEAYAGDRRRPALPADLPAELLSTRAGAFVSIHKQGQLRGCIGTIAPVQANLAREILENAISACSADPRFSPVAPEELPWLEISVDVLGEPEEIDSPEELDVKRYGVIVSAGRKRGLLLPDLEGVDTVEEQIAIARRKAGIGPAEPVRLQRFEVVRHT